MWQWLVLMFLGVGRRAARCWLRNPFDNGGKIRPKAERDKQFCHHEHWPEQQVTRIVHERRLPTFEQSMADNLKTYADEDQYDRSGPYTEGTRIIYDKRSG